MKFLDTITAMLDLKAAEIRTGITLVEAVATEKCLMELAALGDVDELLKIAVTAGKLGLQEADLEPMARAWYMAQSRHNFHPTYGGGENCDPLPGDGKCEPPNGYLKPTALAEAELNRIEGEQQ